MKKVFITRDLSDDSLLFKAEGVEIEGYSLIELQKVDWEEVPTTDWIFFSSPRAIDFFYSQVPPDPSHSIGVVGQVSAQKLAHLGLEPAFIGKGNDTDISARDFAKLVGTATVLFPQSSISLKTFEKYLVPHQVYPLIVYSTKEKKGLLKAEYDVIVFTSPSNVRSFYNNNTWFPKKVIALGRKTALEIEKFHSIPVERPIAYTEASILATL